MSAKKLDDAGPPQRSSRSVQWYLALPVILFVGVAVIGSTYSFLSFRGQNLDDALAEAEFAAEGAGAELGESLSLLRTTVQTVAQAPGIQALFDQSGTNDCTLNFGGPGTEGGSLSVFNTEGAVVCSSHTGADSPPPALAPEWLAAALSGPVLLAPVVDPVSGEHLAVTAEPVPGGGGVVAAIVRAESLGAAITSKYAGLDHVELLFVNGSNVTVHRSGEGDGAAGVPLDGTEFSAAAGHDERPDMDGTVRLYRDVPVGDSGWTVYAGADKGAALAASDRLFLRDLAIMMAALLAVIATALLAHYFVARPVRQIAAGIRQVTAGDYSARVDESLPAEFGDVARGFNGMAAAIEDHEEDRVRQATTDRMTGLLNRSGLEAWMSNEMASGAPLACIYLTVVGFHEMTSTFGYPASEVVLREVGDRLRRAFPQAPVGRLGGNAFALAVLGDDARDDRLQGTAERALQALEPQFDVREVPIHVDFLAGAAAFPDHAGDADLLVRKAEAAARGGGRRHMVFDATQDEPRTNNIQMVTALRDALNRGELELHYQPLLGAKDKKVHGAEALLRWRRDGEWVSPAVFIPVAERSGVMVDVDRWVFREAVSQARRWMDAGIHMRVSINVSARSLEDLDFPDYASEVMETVGVPPDLIVVEITETAAVTLMGNALEVARRFRDLGLGVALDDFGVGNSPIQYLRWFPVSRVKVDLSLVRDITRISEVRLIVQALLEMAKAVNLETVAEGVEDVAQEEILREQGCDYLQGYLYGRPMDVATFEQWLTQVAPA